MSYTITRRRRYVSPLGTTAPTSPPRSNTVPYIVLGVAGLTALVVGQTLLDRAIYHGVTGSDDTWGGYRGTSGGKIALGIAAVVGVGLLTTVAWNASGAPPLPYY